MKAREINKDVEGFKLGYQESVYVIENQYGQVKIGRSKEPDRRFRTIETQGCIDIGKVWISTKCTNADKIEGNLHEIFASNRLKGEWFDQKFDTIVKKAKKQDYVLEYKKQGDSRSLLRAFEQIRNPRIIEEILEMNDCVANGLFYEHDEVDKETLSLLSSHQLDHIHDLFNEQIFHEHNNVNDVLKIWRHQKWDKIDSKEKFARENSLMKGSLQIYDPISQTLTTTARSFDNYLKFFGLKILSFVCRNFKRYTDFKFRLWLKFHRKTFFGFSFFSDIN